MPTELELAVLTTAAIFKKVSDVGEEVVPKAKINREWIFSQPETDWPGLLKSDKDLDEVQEKRIHAITFFYEGIDQEPESAITCFTPILPIGVAFHLQASLGLTGQGAGAQMMAEMLMLRRKLFDMPQLGFDDVDNQDLRGCVESHKGLVMPRIVQFPRLLGGKQVLVCAGRIEVVMSPQQR